MADYVQNIVFKVTTDSKGAVTGVQNIGSQADVTNKKLKGIERAAKSLGNTFKTAATAFGLYFGVEKIISFGKEILDLATKMEQINKRAKIVFGTSLPMITKEAEKSARALGFTKNEFTAAATAAADMLKPMGANTEQAASMSLEVVKLAGALTEWTGGVYSAEEVNLRLTKALLGEREGVKELGIVIQEADVKQRLMEKGQDKLTGQALKLARAEATLELSIESSTDAIKAASDEASNLFRKRRDLGTFWRQFKEDLAEGVNRELEATLYLFDRWAFSIDRIAAMTADNPIEEMTKVLQKYSNALIFGDAQTAELANRIEMMGGAVKENTKDVADLALMMSRKYALSLEQAFTVLRPWLLGLARQNELTKETTEEGNKYNNETERTVGILNNLNRMLAESNKRMQESLTEEDIEKWRQHSVNLQRMIDEYEDLETAVEDVNEDLKEQETY